MTTIRSASTPVPTYSDHAADNVADKATPSMVAEHPAAESADTPARQSSLQERATHASRTRLSTFELSKTGTGSQGQSVVSEDEPSLALNASSSSAMPTLNRSGLAPAPLKAPIYLPGKRRNDNLNTKVNLDAREVDADSHLGSVNVSCRHLAFEYINSPKKADFLSAVQNEAGIKRYFSGGRLRAANQSVLNITAAATLRNSSVVSADMFPAQVMDIARVMTRSRQSNADFLITSSNHAMALNIQIKERGRVCVTVYDPNVTTNHFRVEGRDFSDVDALGTSIAPLMSYRSAGSHAFTLHAKGDFFTPDKAMVNLRSTSNSTPDQVMASFINRALERDDPALLGQLITKTGSDHPRGGKPLKDTLAAAEQGFPGSFAALQNGRAQTLGTWMKGVSHLATQGLLSSDEVCELFKAQATSRGTNSGFNSAIRGGHAETISTYMAYVTDAAVQGLLSRDQVKAIFSAPNNMKAPAFDGMWSGRDLKPMDAVVHQLARCLRKNVLSGDDIKALLHEQGHLMRGRALAGTDSKTIKLFKQSLQPLVSAGVLQKNDLKALFAARGFEEKSVKATLSRVFS